jgi:hypothetical protein
MIGEHYNIDLIDSCSQLYLIIQRQENSTEYIQPYYFLQGEKGERGRVVTKG